MPDNESTDHATDHATDQATDHAAIDSIHAAIDDALPVAHDHVTKTADLTSAVSP